MVTDEEKESYMPLLASEGENNPVAYEDAVKQILAQAVCIGASYTGSFSFIVLAILAGHIDQESDDNANYLSATTLITSTLYPAAAIGTASVFSVLYYMMEKLGQYNDPQLSQQEKEIHKGEISRLVKNIFLFSIVSIPLVAALLVFFLSTPIMRSLFSQNKSDVDLAQQYLNIAAWTIVLLSMRLGFEQILFPFNKQFEVMCIALVTFSLFSVMSAALLCYTFNLKLLGIAIGFSIGELITVLAFGAYLNFVKELKPFQFFNAGWYDAEDLKQVGTLVRIGAPITVSIASELIAFFLINQFAGWLGSDELAAQDIASQVFFITFIPTFAIAQVAAIKTGGAIAEKEHDNAVRYARSALLAVSLVLGIGCLVPLLVYPGVMRAIVTHHASQRVAEISDPAVRLAAATAFFMAISNVLLQTVRCYNAKDFLPTYISSGAAFIGVALGYIFGFQAKWGLNGIIGGYGIGITAGALSLFALSSTRLTVNALTQRKDTLDAHSSVSPQSSTDLEQNSGEVIENPTHQEKPEDSWGRLMSCCGLHAPQYSSVKQSVSPASLNAYIKDS